MRAASPFLDQLGADLQNAYGRQTSRRHRRSVSFMVGLAALVFVATAGASGAIQGWFSIDQSGKGVSIAGRPPAVISCGARGCVLPSSPTASTRGYHRYVFSHTLGQDLPSSGSLQETLPGQAVFDKNGNQLSPPKGAELAYICTTIQGGSLGCSVLRTAGSSLPRGAAIYILSPSEYGPAS